LPHFGNASRKARQEQSAESCDVLYLNVHRTVASFLVYDCWEVQYQYYGHIKWICYFIRNALHLYASDSTALVRARFLKFSQPGSERSYKSWVKPGALRFLFLFKICPAGAKLGFKSSLGVYPVVHLKCWTSCMVQFCLKDLTIHEIVKYTYNTH